MVGNGQLLRVGGTAVASRGRVADVVTLDRDASDMITLRFLSQSDVKRRGSQAIKLDADVAERLLEMLSREFEVEDDWATE
jgi:hypothetical protein